MKTISAIVFLALMFGPSKAANTVDTSATLNWLCTNDLKFSFGQENGELHVVLPSKSVDMRLRAAGCNSSHCAWQSAEVGTECSFANGQPLCAEIAASYKTQQLTLTGAVGNGINVDELCVTIKTRNNWNDILDEAHPLNADQQKAVDEMYPEQPVVKKKKSIWVAVTHPMLSCTAAVDDPALIELLFENLTNMSDQKNFPEGCDMLEVGEKYLLDDEQSEEETKKVVKMWAGTCPQGCVPAMMPFYAPPRSIVGAYLRPTSPPKGWENY